MGASIPDADGGPLPRARVARTSPRWRTVNAVRTYTVPPRWLLDLGAASTACGCSSGLPWEQHVAFLDSRGARARRSSARPRRRRARAPATRRCSATPSATRSPPSIVRWHGRAARRALPRAAVRAAQGGGPGRARHLRELPEHRVPRAPVPRLRLRSTSTSRTDGALAAYLARLQNLAGDRPLVLTELGLDSRRNGEAGAGRGARRAAAHGLRGGCAGALRLLLDRRVAPRRRTTIEDWDFGLVDRERRPKPALAAVRERVRRRRSRSPEPAGRASPSSSARTTARATLGECLDGLGALDYPDYEVDRRRRRLDRRARAEIAARASGVRARSRTPNQRPQRRAQHGPARRRRGEIVAYIDDDARPDPHWLTLPRRSRSRDGDHAAVGGPNLAAAGRRRWSPRASRNAPGGPTHVLLSDDRVAEHIPGCNMAFRRDALRGDRRLRPAVPRRRRRRRRLLAAAGARAGRIGFAPAAVVWHHRRGRRPRAIWRQQRGYGQAEALLERKWPEKYNRPATSPGAGASTAALALPRCSRRARIYYGVWGTGAVPAGDRAAAAGLLLALAAHARVVPRAGCARRARRVSACCGAPLLARAAALLAHRRGRVAARGRRARPRAALRLREPRSRRRARRRGALTALLHARSSRSRASPAASSTGSRRGAAPAAAASRPPRSRRDVRLERALAAPADRGWPARGGAARRRARAARRRVRALGARGPRRRAGRRARARGASRSTGAGRQLRRLRRGPSPRVPPWLGALAVLGAGARRVRRRRPRLGPRRGRTAAAGASGDCCRARSRAARCADARTSRRRDARRHGGRAPCRAPTRARHEPPALPRRARRRASR